MSVVNKSVIVESRIEVADSLWCHCAAATVD